MAKILDVWTNGNGIRKYVGQEKLEENSYPESPNATQLHSMKDGWHRNKAVLISEEELNQYYKDMKELDYLRKDNIKRVFEQNLKKIRLRGSI